jgi:diaminopimelate epimerase
MSGSGNDFVFIDARHEPAGALDSPTRIQAICARGTGVGADGIVFLEPSPRATVRMRYLNSDGSLAAMCGNASLCTARLLIELGGATPGQEFTIESDSGVLGARMTGENPEVDLAPVDRIDVEAETGVAPGEKRAGYAVVGVPHLVLLQDDISQVDVVGRGRPLRFHHALGPAGANVNFVAPAGDPGAWLMRTYERGVEAETLACGTGAVACALMLAAWGLAQDRTVMVTRSGKRLTIRSRRVGGQVLPSLSGEARVVYQGRLAEI